MFPDWWKQMILCSFLFFFFSLTVNMVFACLLTCEEIK